MAGRRVKFLRFTFSSYIGGSLYCFKLFLIRNSDFFHRVCVHVFVLFLLLIFPVIAFYLIRIHFPFLRCLHSSLLPAAVEKNLTIRYTSYVCFLPFNASSFVFHIIYIVTISFDSCQEFYSVACKWLCAFGPMPHFPWYFMYVYSVPNARTFLTFMNSCIVMQLW
jgi:hypothetical protein